tara:strand:+ start:947 stop:2782 length:1836 start_codon:yes stop_codon:yes gene_type:complete
VTDLYSSVPKTLKENLEFRRKICASATDIEVQRQLWTACKRDILFFINTFCWLYEPRNSRLRGTTSNVIPFITYEFQDNALLQMNEALGEQDVGIEKSRDLGATWMFLTLFFYHWMFHDFSSFGVMSRNADLVDKPGKKDTLMWKLDFLLKGDGNRGGLPSWMQPNSYRSIMLLENRDNGSTFEGASTTEDAFRGGRKKAIALDEFAAFPSGADYEAQAATQHATDSRFFVSTPKGASGAYYDVMHTPSNMVRVVMDWKMHPDRRIGMYTTEEGELKLVDPEYPHPEGYKFVLDGKERSPYYDTECNRPGATAQSIAQELDRDYGGSEYQIFGKELYENAREGLKVPYQQGIFRYIPETYECDFSTSEDGPLHLWCHRDGRGRPVPTGEYVIGVDVSAGLGGSYTSNSVAVVADAVTGEQVAEYVTNTTPPGDFAELVVSMSKWFRNAYLVWESNGPPGMAFTRRVLDTTYPNIYFRQMDARAWRKKTRNPGWYSNEKNKLALLSDFATSVKSGEYCIRSRLLIEECRQYIYKDGKVVHSRSVRTRDDSSKGQAHGDRVIAAALAWHGIKDRPATAKTEETFTEEIPSGSMAWRFLEAEDRLAMQQNDGWN